MGFSLAAHCVQVLLQLHFICDAFAAQVLGVPCW